MPLSLLHRPERVDMRLPRPVRYARPHPGELRFWFRFRWTRRKVATALSAVAFTGCITRTASGMAQPAVLPINQPMCQERN
jgi:hypothetical protein